MNLKENTGVSFHSYILWSLFRELYMVHQQPETHFTSKQPHHSQCPSCLPLSSSVSCSPSRHELTAHNQAEQALMKVLILLGGHAYPRAAVKRAKESSLSQVHVIGNSMWTNKRQIDLWGGGGTWLFSDGYPPPEWSKGWEAFFLLFIKGWTFVCIYDSLRI